MKPDQTPNGTKTFVGGGQFGSEAKGSVVGWLSRRHPYTAAVAAFPPSAGHTYVWEGNKIMHIMLPISVVSKTVREVFIGPGALIDPERLEFEINQARSMGLLDEKQIIIHEHAGVVTSEHAHHEMLGGLTNIGSTVKGGMAAQIEKMRRHPLINNIASTSFSGTPLARYVADRFDYLRALERHADVMIEGSQGFGLSIHHGFYPYVTARDTTPWAVAQDCGLPWSWASQIETVWVLRTFPIRVNNRTGSSGPVYQDSVEITFDQIGQSTELTTVTKLPRRIFTFSEMQLEHLRDQCCDEKSYIALTFCNYMPSRADAIRMIRHIESVSGLKVRIVNFGPDDKDMTSFDSKEV